jgi:hypothetical protein
MDIVDNLLKLKEKIMKLDTEKDNIIFLTLNVGCVEDPETTTNYILLQIKDLIKKGVIKLSPKDLYVNLYGGRAECKRIARMAINKRIENIIGSNSNIPISCGFLNFNELIRVYNKITMTIHDVLPDLPDEKLIGFNVCNIPVEQLFKNEEFKIFIMRSEFKRGELTLKTYVKIMALIQAFNED